MSKKNCWEIKNCGREPGGSKINELGVCVAASNNTSDGKNDGINAGRYCWRIAGTFCGGKVQGDMGSKIMDCVECDFFQQVKEEEGLIFSV